MIYFKNIANRITTNGELIKRIENMNNDKLIFKLLSEAYSVEEVEMSFEKYYGVQYVDLKEVEVSKKTLKGFEIEKFKELSIIPFSIDEDNKEYSISLNDFMNKALIDSISKVLASNGYKSKFYFSFKEDISEKYIEIESGEKAKTSKRVDSEALQSKKGRINAKEWLDNVMDTGINLDASDIHIERVENGVQVRYRIDGVLTNKSIYNLNEEDISSIFVRIKIISNMDISEKRRPQDGRIDNYDFNNKVYDVRVSTVSLMVGEKVVMRIFDKNDGFKTYEAIGFSKEGTNKIKKMLSKNNGIIYLSGATGSGKTTTLYTMIETINKDSINIYTIENPVERTIENVNQIQVDPLGGIDYPSTLRALLRQDPDVIVVGEIRDAETAELSIRASLTGHLVLSTLHSNNALDAISRLLDMGIEPYLISASSIGFLSQRLVRVLCPHCKEKVDKLSTSERIWLDNLTKKYELEHIDDTEFYRAKGCKECNSGYRGRTALVEIVEVTDVLKKLLSQGANASEIKDEVMKNGFSPIELEGIKEALSGNTSIAELMRQIN